MKRFISFLCILTMLLSSLVVFSACKKDNEEIKVSKKEISVDLSAYTVVYDDDLTATGLAHLNTVLKSIQESTVLSLQRKCEEETAENDGKEILIGITERDESQKTLKKLGDCGWGIRVFENKIVIVGTTPFMTRAALTYFEENYLKKTLDGTTLTLNEKAILADVPTTALFYGGTEQYKVVYSDDTDDKPDKPTTYDRSPTSVGGTGVDYVFKMAQGTQAYLIQETSLRAGEVGLEDDDDGAESALEILIGKNNRAVYMQQLRLLDADEYAVSIIDGKIMLLGWHEATLDLAYSDFCDLVDSSLKENADGEFDCYLPKYLFVKGTLEHSFATDFPKPEGALLHGVVDVGDNSLEYIYAGDGATRACYDAYCDTLEAAGYQALAAEYVAEDNAFVTYVNESAGITLHVYYAAYKHADRAAMNDSLAGIRVISAYTSSVALPDASILSPQSYTKVCESAITSPQMNKEGMSYIITLEDGTFVVLDGGLAVEQELLWSTLVKLHTDIHGAPTEENRIHVRAWFLSHEHSDHASAFVSLFDNETELALLKLDYLLLNTGGKWESYNSENVTSGWVRAKVTAFQKKIEGGFTYLKPHTGQIFYFANLKMEIMLTHEDHYPTKVEWYNNMSTIIRTTITSTGEGGSKESTAVWLGDAEALNGRRLIGLWGDRLKSDMVQLAHHGSLGVEQAVYDIINPEVVWYPGLAGRFVKSTAKPTSWYAKLDHYVTWQLEGVKYVIFYSKEQGVTMTLTGTGYDPAVRDVMTGTAVEFQVEPDTYYPYISRGNS